MCARNSAAETAFTLFTGTMPYYLDAEMIRPDVQKREQEFHSKLLYFVPISNTIQLLESIVVAYHEEETKPPGTLRFSRNSRLRKTVSQTLHIAVDRR